jgi:FKBP-type peptidyl-prolyl cis-trans isomerase FklB
MKALSLLSSAMLLFVTSCQTKPVRKEAVPPPPTQQSSPNTSAVSSSPQLPQIDSSGKVTTSSGLQYRVLSSGPADGRSPTFFDSVMVHYRGTLTDGTVFDSSIERGVPATFGVGQVIPGWTEALKLMKPGDQWELFIPSRLAYGNRAVGDKIPPNSDLIFKVALLQIVGGS